MVGDEKAELAGILGEAESWEKMARTLISALGLRLQRILMIIPDHVDQDPMHQLWGLLTEIGEQQNQNRNIAHELHTKANDLKVSVP